MSLSSLTRTRSSSARRPCAAQHAHRWRHVAPCISAVITDVTLTSYVVPICNEVHVLCHMIFISSATMLSLLAYFPVHLNKKGEKVSSVDIPGVHRILRSWLPQPLLDLDKLFAKQFIDNDREITKADNILVNTFHGLEPEALAALRSSPVFHQCTPSAQRSRIDQRRMMVKKLQALLWPGFRSNLCTHGSHPSNPLPSSVTPVAG
jgi:hypothetical protein